MIKSFYRLVDKKMIALLILMLVISPTLCGKNTYTICLIYSHYLTIYMNNVYLLMMYQYASRCQTLSAYIITRIGQQKYWFALHYHYLYQLLFFLWCHSIRVIFIHNLFYDYKYNCDWSWKYTYIFTSWYQKEFTLFDFPYNYQCLISFFIYKFILKENIIC